MGGSEAKQGAYTTTPKTSVRIRVVAGLILIMLAFACLTVYSIVLHRRTVAKIELINSSYLPLTRGSEEIRATQLVFNIFLDRLTDDPGSRMAREWIDTARIYRPSTLRELSKVITASLAKDIPSDEAAFLMQIWRRLQDVSRFYGQNESQFLELYSLMDTGHVDEARVRIEKLKRIERRLDRVLKALGEEIRQHITALAEEGEQDGTRATFVLGLLTVVVLAIATAVAISINHLLTPLKTLQEAVRQVARGDLSTQIAVERSDEIGALATGFNRMTEALADRDQMLIRSEQLAAAGKMAAKVTHEIRNPLSSLGLNAELLEDELEQGTDTKEARSLLRAMQDEIERLTKITESYLRFARLPSPLPKFDDLNDAVTNAVDFMKNEFDENKIQVELDLDSSIGLLLFDRSQIRQSLSNLLKNACDAMPEGGKLTIKTGRRSNHTVELAITDTGSGVPEDAQEHIFESFFSTKSSGTGLGLPMVRQICTAHGGSVRCQNTGSTGSTFIVALPDVRKTDEKKATV